MFHSETRRLRTLRNSQPRVLLPRDVFGAIGWRVAHGGGPFAVFSGFVADVGAALGAGVAAATCVGADSTASMARARSVCLAQRRGADVAGDAAQRALMTAARVDGSPRG